MLAILGFLVATAVLTGRQERQLAGPRRSELVRLIEDRRSLIDDLDEAVEKLRHDLAREQERVSSHDVRESEAARRAELLAEQAGTVSVRGKGLLVQLAHSKREPPSPEEAGAYQIHDSDLQLVVNALFAAGAEAVAINGSRLVATTPIRAAGGTIVVNFRPVSPPFRVVAIGAERRRFEQSEIVRRFQRWSNLFGLGFDVREERSLTVPAYTGRVTLSSATPVVPAQEPDRQGEPAVGRRRR